MKSKFPLIVGSFCLFSISNAADWQDLLAAVESEAQKYEFLDDGQYHQGKLYNALVTYRVINGNNNHDLDPDERVYVKVVGVNGLVIQTPSDGYTEDGLKTWAENHANSLVEAVFGGDPAQTVSGNAPAINSIVTVATSISTTTTSVNYVYNLSGSTSTTASETSYTTETSSGISTGRESKSTGYTTNEKQSKNSQSTKNEKEEKKRYIEYYTYRSY